MKEHRLKKFAFLTLNEVRNHKALQRGFVNTFFVSWKVNEARKKQNHRFLAKREKMQSHPHRWSKSKRQAKSCMQEFSDAVYFVVPPFADRYTMLGKLASFRDKFALLAKERRNAEQCTLNPSYYRRTSTLQDVRACQMELFCEIARCRARNLCSEHQWAQILNYLDSCQLAGPQGTMLTLDGLVYTLGLCEAKEVNISLFGISHVLTTVKLNFTHPAEQGYENFDALAKRMERSIRCDNNYGQLVAQETAYYSKNGQPFVTTHVIVEQDMLHINSILNETLLQTTRFQFMHLIDLVLEKLKYKKLLTISDVKASIFISHAICCLDATDPFTQSVLETSDNNKRGQRHQDITCIQHDTVVAFWSLMILDSFLQIDMVHSLIWVFNMNKTSQPRAQHYPGLLVDFYESGKHAASQKTKDYLTFLITPASPYQKRRSPFALVRTISGQVSAFHHKQQIDESIQRMCIAAHKIYACYIQRVLLPKCAVFFSQLHLQKSVLRLGRLTHLAQCFSTRIQTSRSCELARLQQSMLRFGLLLHITPWISVKIQVSRLCRVIRLRLGVQRWLEKARKTLAKENLNAQRKEREKLKKVTRRQAKKVKMFAKLVVVCRLRCVLHFFAKRAKLKIEQKHLLNEMQKALALELKKTEDEKAQLEQTFTTQQEAERIRQAVLERFSTHEEEGKKNVAHVHLLRAVLRGVVYVAKTCLETFMKMKPPKKSIANEIDDYIYLVQYGFDPFAFHSLMCTACKENVDDSFESCGPHVRVVGKHYARIIKPLGLPTFSEKLLSWLKSSTILKKFAKCEDLFVMMSRLFCDLRRRILHTPDRLLNEGGLFQTEFSYDLFHNDEALLEFGETYSDLCFVWQADPQALVESVDEWLKQNSRATQKFSLLAFLAGFEKARQMTQDVIIHGGSRGLFLESKQHDNGKKQHKFLAKDEDFIVVIEPKP